MVRLWSVVFDADDPVVLGRFWAEALGWDFRRADDDGSASAAATDGSLPRLEFVAAPPSSGPRPTNRMHFDLSSRSEEDQRATVARLVALGGREIDIGQGPDSDHAVLADPEGNPFCVLEPTNSFVDRASRLGSVTCDGSRAVGHFWSEALGWPLVWDQDEETAIRSADGGVFVTFGGEAADPTRAKHRLHLDVAPALGDDQASTVDRLVSLGARRLADAAHETGSTVLADPDGNAFCVRR